MSSFNFPPKPIEPAGRWADMAEPAEATPPPKQARGADNSMRRGGAKMTGDKDLNDDMIKRVRYWAIYTERGFETTFPDKYRTVTGRKDESTFISARAAEFHRAVDGMEIPEEWRKRQPRGVEVNTKDSGKTDPGSGKDTVPKPIMVAVSLKAIGHPASEFLAIDYEVVGRYQKEDLQMDDRQARFYDSGTNYFEKNS